MIDPRKLPEAMRRQLWQVVVLLALLLAVVFMLGFTVGRWVEHGR